MPCADIVEFITENTETLNCATEFTERSYSLLMNIIPISTYFSISLFLDGEVYGMTSPFQTTKSSHPPVSVASPYF